MKKRRIFIAAIALAAAVPAAAQETAEEERNWAVVEFSTNFMREEPDYTAENGDQALMGTVVEIIGEKDYWRHIVTPEPYTAWVNEMGIVPMTQEEVNDYIDCLKYICIKDFTHIYAEPSTESERISDFVMGNLVRSLFNSKGKPMKSGRFVACMLPSGKCGWVLKNEVEDFDTWTATREMTADAIINTAFDFLGVPYMWGGTSIKHVDCSGLVRSVFFMNGILLPRNASQQAKAGVPVALDALEPGDLLFFGTPSDGVSPDRISHVGIYMGEGVYIHSSQVVRISSLDSGSEDYGGRDPLKACRILGHVDDGHGAVSISRSPYYFAQPERNQY
ncbi:MAG: SH3 domain-containing C40 family peptidase [Bacteroidia bacterium]|nr:SH3 domain-containing C40 family peptidase [Bacteroidia bacterium]